MYKKAKDLIRKLVPEKIFKFLLDYKIIVKYLISGGTAASADLVVLFVLTDLVELYYIVSASIAFVIAFFISFYLQKFWTFRDESKDKIMEQLSMYLTLALINLGINAGGMYFLVDNMDLHYILAQIIVMASIAVGSFMIYRFIIFKKGYEKNNVAKKIKLLIATGIYPPDIGGPAVMINALANSLSSRDFEIKVITYSCVKCSNNESFEVCRVNKKNPKLFCYLSYFVRMFKMSRWADIVYVTDIYSVGYFAKIINKIIGKKYIIRFAGDSAWETSVARGWVSDNLDEFLRKEYNSKIEKLKKKRMQIMIKADKVLTVSNFLASVAEKIGVRRKRIRTIYNSVDFTKINNIGDSEVESIKNKFEANAKLILTSCRLTPWKGVDGIIKVIPELIKSVGNVNFIVIGEGQEKGELVKLVREKRLDNKVYFLGALSHVDTFKYFKAADLYVLNTNYEGLSHALLDAMKLEVPILTTTAGGNPETIEDKKEGRLVEFNNHTQLLEAAVQILSDNDLAHSYVQAAKEKLNKFSWEANIKQTEELIKEVYYG